MNINLLLLIEDVCVSAFEPESKSDLNWVICIAGGIISLDAIEPGLTSAATSSQDIHHILRSRLLLIVVVSRVFLVVLPDNLHPNEHNCLVGVASQ